MSDTMKHFIVIDGGTQNIKAFIFDEDRQRSSRRVIACEPHTLPCSLILLSRMLKLICR